MILRRTLLALVALALAACSLLSPSEDALSQGPQGCPPGTKRCGELCVSTANPAVGCGAIDCSPCAALPHASTTCLAGRCAAGACETGRGDCDGNQENGCETDLRSALGHCGGCGKACTPAHGAVRCDQGACRSDSCDDGWGNCDGIPDNGCETDLASSPSHCGGCGDACKASQVCQQGKCVSDGDVSAWLDQQKGGFCLGAYNQIINLCGSIGTCAAFKNICLDEDLKLPGKTCWEDLGHDYSAIEGWPGSVPFCCEPSIFKAYPEGLALDIGFHYTGSSTGILLDMGGDGEGKRVSLSFEAPGQLRLQPSSGADILQASVSAGAHLVSIRLTASTTELILDGVSVAKGQGPQLPPELVPKFGPGLVLGQRISYWFESTTAARWLRVAPFFFHLRDRVEPSWSLEEVLSPGAHTLLLLEPGGAEGNQWKPTKGPLTATAIDGRLGMPTPPLSQPAWLPKIGGVCF